MEAALSMTICPNCGEDNPDKAKFCLECGTSLQVTAPSQAEERKVVSVLFVDLVGFTARSHDADPEDVRAVLAPYHQRLKREIEGFGGTVEKFIGDAVMAVFGAPVAHEDDAERAVRAALRITEAIEELNQSKPNLDLSIRGAVNTGEGLVNLSARPQAGEGMVTGDVVNTASRLQGVAPINGVVVGEITYRSTKDIIDYEERQPVEVKGKPEPIPVWRATSARSRFGVDVETLHRTPFIGRDFDLATLKSTYQRTLRESSLQLTTIVGEPGVGKSRLLAEFSAYVDEQEELVFWRQGRSLSYGEGITFWALGEIVKAQAGINESDSSEVATEKLATAIGAVVADEADKAWLQGRLAPLVGATLTAGGGAEKEESFTAWRRFFEAIAATRPLILVFEDLHWADASLLEFIEHLVEWSSGVPLLTICTSRPELFDKHPAWGASLHNQTIISLLPLTDSEIAQLISALLSQAVLSAEIHAAVLERAEGNPLYAEEFIRMLSDRGALQQKGGTLTLAPATDIPVPENVHALIAARLDMLALNRKALLYDAAVVGKVFWPGALASLSGVDELTTRHALQELVHKELVRPSRTSSVEGQQEYSFWHALIRDVAYAQIPRRFRASRHRDTARWIEVVTGDRVSDQAEVLAYHYGEALELVRAIGDAAETSRLEGPARRSLTAAGDRAVEFDAAQAHAYYVRALDLMPHGHPERARVLVQAGWTARNIGRLEEAMQLYEAGIVNARSCKDIVMEGSAMARLAGALWYMGETGRSRELGARAVNLLEQQPPGEALIGARLGLSDDAIFAGDLATALYQAEAALALAQNLGTQKHAVDARAQRGWVRCELGDLEGMADLREALETGLRLGLGGVVVSVYDALVPWTWWVEGPVLARGLSDEAIRFAEARGMAVAALVAKVNLLDILFDLGEWNKLMSLTNELLKANEMTNSLQLEVNALFGRAHVLALRGQVNQAVALKERFLPLAREIGDLQCLIPAIAIASLVEWGLRDSATAVRLVSELEELTRGSRWRAHMLPTVLRIVNAAGKVALVEALLADVEVSAPRDKYSVMSGEATLAESRGHHERGLELYEEATRCWADYGYVMEEGQAHLGQGRCLLAMSRSTEATPRLHQAHAIFTRLGARPLIDEVNGHLAQATALSS